MFPISARVLFPALVAVVSGLWAIAEWQAEHALAEPVELDAEAEREARDARDRRETARLELAERKQRLAEAREARLARKVAEPGAGGA